MCFDRLDTLFLKNPSTTVNDTFKQQIIGSIILIEQEQERKHASLPLYYTDYNYYIDYNTSLAPFNNFMCYDRLDALFLKNPFTTVSGTVKQQIIRSIILIEHTHLQARYLLTILCVMIGLILYFLKIL